MRNLRWLVTVFVVGCAGTQSKRGTTPPVDEKLPFGIDMACDDLQLEILRIVDFIASWEARRHPERHRPRSTAQHLATSFSDGRVSWVMNVADFKTHIANKNKQHWGRPQESEASSYVFVVPEKEMDVLIKESTSNGTFDHLQLEKRLGLDPNKLAGQVLRMTLDLKTKPVCARLPLWNDLGSAKGCPIDVDPIKLKGQPCFLFGGATTGEMHELILINAPVAQTTCELYSQTQDMTTGIRGTHEPGNCARVATEAKEAPRAE